MRCIFHKTDQFDRQSVASQSISYLEDMEITRTDVASGFLQDVQAHIGRRFNGIVQLLEASVWDKVEKAFKPCWLSPPRCHQRRR